MILPFGGRDGGHKGSALAALVESTAWLPDIEGTGTGADANSLTLIAIDTNAGFAEHADAFVDRVRSARPIDPASPPRAPGVDHPRRRATTSELDIDEVTLGRLRAASDAFGVAVPAT